MERESQLSLSPLLQLSSNINVAPHLPSISSVTEVKIALSISLHTQKTLSPESKGRYSRFPLYSCPWPRIMSSAIEIGLLSLCGARLGSPSGKLRQIPRSNYASLTRSTEYKILTPLLVYALEKRRRSDEGKGSTRPQNLIPINRVFLFLKSVRLKHRHHQGQPINMIYPQARFTQWVFVNVW